MNWLSRKIKSHWKWLRSNNETIQRPCSFLSSILLWMCQTDFRFFWDGLQFLQMYPFPFLPFSQKEGAMGYDEFKSGSFMSHLKQRKEGSVAFSVPMVCEPFTIMSRNTGNSSVKYEPYLCKDTSTFFFYFSKWDPANLTYPKVRTKEHYFMRHLVHKSMRNTIDLCSMNDLLWWKWHSAYPWLERVYSLATTSHFFNFWVWFY